MKAKPSQTFKVQELEVRFKPGRKPTALVQVQSPEDLYKFLKPLIADQPREQLLCLSITAAGVVGLEVVSKGTSNYAIASPSEILKAPIITNASDFIVAHNHPSGHTEPSREDRELAKLLKDAAKIMGMSMLDFIILTSQTFYSFARNGEL
jgi:DNA repair protein RadC